MEAVVVTTLEAIEEDLRRRGIKPGRREDATQPEVFFQEPSVWYGARTMWWTTRPEHLWTHQELAVHDPWFARSNEGKGLTPGSLPCDPRGGVLMMGCAWAFLEAARANATHYGRHGLKALEAAYHGNLILGLKTPRPWTAVKWDEVNDALDRAADREAQARGH